ncbi:lantibiotic dehydratase [Streptomyces olivaceoviridis]
MSSRPAFRAERGILVRSVLLHNLPIPPAPDLSTPGSTEPPLWQHWVRQVWSIPQIADAVRQASPGLGRQIDDLAEQPVGAEELRRLGLSLLSYVLRATWRPTPFGLFAGIAEGRFGTEARAWRGEDHRTLTRADGAWLTAVVQQLEADPDVRRRLRVVINNGVRVRGDRLVLPWQQRALDAAGTAVHEVTLRHTPAVQTIVRMAGTPVPYGKVAGELAAAHPDLGATGGEELLDLLIRRRVLLSSLQPPSTSKDALGHVVRELEAACLPPSAAATGLIAALRDIDAQLGSLNQQQRQAPAQRAVVTGRMREIVDQPTPLAVDVALDADVVVPHAVAWEAQAAAGVLARVTPEPHGTQAWIRYRARFRDRYGEGVLVPLMDLLDPHTGLGLPEDFHGSVRAPQPNTVRRDRLLMALAQRAVAEGRELVLDEHLIEELAGPQPATAADAPPHVELAVCVHAVTAARLNAGEFTLAVRRVSRGWGHLSGGRFAALLASQDSPSDLLGMLARRPTSVHGALPVQLAFPPLMPKATRITHTPRLTAPLISLSEFREPDASVIPPDDLAVICHQDRLHLVCLSRRQVLEASTPHPLQIECQTPAIARFLDEMQRGQSSRLIGSIGNLSAWDWGAARHLAVLPRVRVGRTILAPATWRLAYTGLPGSHAPDEEWETAFAALRTRWRLPRHVRLELWDTWLRLDLDHAAHRALLRSRLERDETFGPLTLTEAEPDDAYGWCDNRPHELVTYLSSTAPRRPAPPLPAAPLAGRGQAHLPGASPYMAVRLYCQRQTRHALLVDHLPALVTHLPGALWWLTPRDKDETPHTVLTIRLADPAQAGQAMRTLGAWAGHLMDAGVVSDALFAPYRPHTGLWGAGKTLQAVEDILAADSAVIAHQHAHLYSLPPSPALAAANVVAIATSLHHDTAAGMRWLSAQPKPPAANRLSRTLLEQARTLATPDDGWSALRETPSGQNLIDGPWTVRDNALRTYRTALDTAAHLDVDAVLQELTAAHLRLAGEPTDGAAWRLARAVALATTRPRRSTGS